MNKRNSTRRLVYTLLIAVAIFVIADLGGSAYMLDYALSNKDRDTVVANGFADAMERDPELQPWLDSLQQAQLLRDTFATMPDGQRMHAIFVRSTEAHGCTALLVHGYHDRSTSMLQIAYIYNKHLHYNVILPDLHGHGLSNGDDVQMGWKDRKDILNWADVAKRTFANGEDSVRMVVHGISMGAATTMCVSGEDTPTFIKCFVEDCGYTSAWDEFAHELNQQFGLPPFPLLHSTSILCDVVYGWSFREASPLKQVSKCKKPMLFIHGDKDDFVGKWME